MPTRLILSLALPLYGSCLTIAARGARRARNLHMQVGQPFPSSDRWGQHIVSAPSVKKPAVPVLVLHKDESVPWQTAVGVLQMAGIGADVALRLMSTVNQRGQGIVVQGTQDNCLLMAGMFREIGMKTTVQAA